MKEHVKYIPLILFVAFCVKGLVLGVSLQEAPIFAIIAGFSAYLVNREEKKNLETIGNRLNKLEQETEAKNKEVEELRSHVSTLKLGQQVRSAVKF